MKGFFNSGDECAQVMSVQVMSALVVHYCQSSVVQVVLRMKLSSITVQVKPHLTRFRVHLIESEGTVRVRFICACAAREVKSERARRARAHPSPHLIPRK